MWLSARHIVDKKSGQEVLILFLDCEGIGSLERTPVEDMLHCLLAGAVSSFTMFKTASAFNRCALFLVPQATCKPLMALILQLSLYPFVNILYTFDLSVSGTVEFALT